MEREREAKRARRRRFGRFRFAVFSRPTKKTRRSPVVHPLPALGHELLEGLLVAGALEQRESRCLGCRRKRRSLHSHRGSSSSVDTFPLRRPRGSREHRCWRLSMPRWPLLPYRARVLGGDASVEREGIVMSKMGFFVFFVFHPRTSALPLSRRFAFGDCLLPFLALPLSAPCPRSQVRSLFVLSSSQRSLVSSLFSLVSHAWPPPFRARRSSSSIDFDLPFAGQRRRSRLPSPFAPLRTRTRPSPVRSDRSQQRATELFLSRTTKKQQEAEEQLA